MRRFSTTLAIAISILLFVSICSAQQTPTTSVPNLIRYSGTLKDAQGAALSSSTAVGVTFSVYKQQDGGAAVWMETQNVTPDANGQYNVILGSTTATGLPDDLFLQQEQRWLGVQVQGEAEQARVLLVSVPYAFKAHEAETLGGLPASAFVKAPPSDGSGGTSTGSGTAVNAVANASANPSGKGKAGKDTILGPCTVTPGYITYWDSTGALCASHLFQLGNGNIGIGITNPSEPLDVKGVISTYQWYDINENRIVSVHNTLSSPAPSTSTNLFLGWNSGTVTPITSVDNTFTGRDTGPFNNLGHDNTFSGYRAGFGNVNGSANSCFGSTACLHNTAGADNVAVGDSACFRNAIGNNNVCIGTQSGFGVLSQSDYNHNTFTGWEAGFTNMTGGDNNVFYGYQAGVANLTGHNNVFYGYQAGRTNTIESNNVYLAHFGVAGDNNTIRIGMKGTGSFQQNKVFVDPILLYPTSSPYPDVVTIDNPSGKLGHAPYPTGILTGSCPPGTGGFFLTQWLSLNTVGCSPIFHKTSNDFIGIGTTNPSTELDVNGDINAKYDRTSYQINEQTVLQVWGAARNNLAVGVGACPQGAGGLNTCVGAGAGFADSGGYYNTFVGGVAGAATQSGNDNTCVGAEACQNNITGTANVAVGAAAGSFNNNRDNVFVGQAAGFQNTGADNIFIGYSAGDDAPATQSKTIRIGWYPGFLTDTYIQGIWGSTVPAPSTVVCVNAAGKLGSIHPGCSLSLQGQIKTELDQVIAQQQQQIESLQKQNAEFQQRLTRLEALIAQK